jgi:SAM-dependent methyltransferase
MSASSPGAKPSDGHNYYHNLVTWLSFDPIRRALNAAITGNPEKTWADYVRETYAPFQHCLSLNCGNGWVERDLFAKGIIYSATGTDIGEGALQQAREQAKAIQLPARYLRLDINQDPLPKEGIDLVLNHAAMHHVTRIDQVMRQLCEILPTDGLFLSFDYTGPHRNQYPYKDWARMIEFNQQQPVELRNANLTYPHLPTMLALDPSEAVHSELIIEVAHRYFIPEYCVPLGGVFAYQLMHDHTHLDRMKHTPEGQALVEEILQIDAGLTREAPESNLFTFLLMRPNKSVLADHAQLREWTRQEEERENRATRNGGLYYPKTALQIITEELAMARYQLSLLAPS